MTDDSNAPSSMELYDSLWEKESGFTSVFRQSDDSWRHGAYVKQVFRREADQSFWRASYRLSTDHETNELKDGNAEIVRVYPREVTTTVYENAPR